MKLSRRNGFTRHLLEAISLNGSRMKMYSELSGGSTLKFSRSLILSEILALPVAFILDLICRPYQNAGIPIGDVEYISMDHAPAFQNHYPFDPEPISLYEKVDGRELSLKLKAAFRRGGCHELSRVTQIELQRLDSPKAYHAMTRHLLESLLRTSNWAWIHHEQALAKGMKSPLWISKLMIKGHFPLFKNSVKLDSDLAPIQSKGIPFLWQDVPHIPPL